MSLKEKDDSEERKKRMLIRGMREGQRDLVVEERKQEVSSLMEDFEECTPSRAMTFPCSNPFYPNILREVEGALRSTSMSAMGETRDHT